MKPVVRNIGLILLAVVLCLSESHVRQTQAQKKSRAQSNTTPVEPKGTSKIPQKAPDPPADLPVKSRERPSEILNTSKFIGYSANSAVDKVEYGPPISYTGLNNPKFMSSVYEHRWDEVPLEGAQKAFLIASTIGELSERCPNIAPNKDVFALYNLLRALKYEELKEYGKTVEGKGNADTWASFARISAGIRYPDAVADVQLFLKRVKDKYKDNFECAKPETKNFAQSLVTYAEFMPVGNELVPPGDTVEYRQLVKNCRQSTIRKDLGSEWCGCYAKAVATAGIKGEMLKALADNPFIDYRTYLWGVMEAAPSFSKLVYECRGSDRPPAPDFTTACLLKKEKDPTGKTQCTYSSAFGDFTVQEDTFKVSPNDDGFDCRPVVKSSRWGTQEVSCSATGVASITPPPEFRRYVVNRLTTMIDYEAPVAADFVPPIPDFSIPKDLQGRGFKASLRIRLLKQENVGSLKEVEVSHNDTSIYTYFGRLPSREEQEILMDDYRIYGGSASLLVCQYYQGNASTKSQTYWFREVPANVLQNRALIASRLPNHPLLRMTARGQCPARLEGR